MDLEKAMRLAGDPQNASLVTHRLADEIERLRKELKSEAHGHKCMTEECGQLRKEKDSRIYYQNIVYKCCNLLDAFLKPYINEYIGIVCGTKDKPSTELQDRLATVLTEFSDARAAIGQIRNELDLRLGRRHDCLVCGGKVPFTGAVYCSEKCWRAAGKDKL